MEKAHLLGQLQTTKNNFALVQLSIALMAQPDALEIFERTLESVKEQPEVDSFAYIRYVYDREDLLKLATRQFRNSVLRNCLKETFELVKDYGDAHGQLKVIQSAPWYRFLRMIRNCLSHDMRFRFNEYDRKQLPVSWSGLTIVAAMDGQPLAMQDFLTRAKAAELIDEVMRYVEQHAR